MPSTDRSASTKLPVAPDVDLILNRISLGLAKHERVLETLRKRAPSSQPEEPPSSSGFSSLRGGGGRTPRPSSGAGTGANDDDDAEFRAERALPYNAGIGWQPAVGGDASGSAAKGRGDAALRARLLGRGGRRGGIGQLGGKKRGRVEDSESEEEEGRSALGRGKKKTTMTKIAGSGEGEEGGIAEEESQPLGVAPLQTSEEPREAISTGPGAGASKKRRKEKKNKKRKKGTGAT